MKNVFEYLIEIKDPGELKLTLAILAKAAEYPDDGVAVNYTEIRSLTGLSSTSIGRAIDQVLARGLIIRGTGKGNGPGHYRVLWEKFYLGRGFNHAVHPSQRSDTSARIPESEKLKFYFTDTGFIDLLPQAIDIATKLGYEEEDMIQAVCLVFDAQRTNPPTRNRTTWFRIVFTEKLGESHAQILAFRKRNPSLCNSKHSTI